MAFDLEARRARLAELIEDRDAILERSMPLREKRDKIVNAAREKEDALNDQIRTAELGLFDITNEIAFLSRALSGR